MEGISLGSADEETIQTDYIFAIVTFKVDGMTGYWPFVPERNPVSYYLAKGVPTMPKEILLSAKCLIKW